MKTKIHIGYIPTVPPGHGGWGTGPSELLTVISDSQSTAQHGLGQKLQATADRAYGAAFKVRARPKASALYQRYIVEARELPKNLYVTQPPIKLEGQSGELALALLYLLSWDNTLPNRSFIATGCLNSSIVKVKIEPVNGIEQKLSLIKEWATQQEEKHETPLYFFIPEHDFTEIELNLIRDLSELSIEVRQVSTLCQAAQYLGLKTAPEYKAITIADRVSAIIVTSLVCVVIGFISMNEWMKYSIPLGLDKVFTDCENGRLLALPLEAPKVPMGTQLGWRIHVGDPYQLDVLLMRALRKEYGYHVAYASISEHSPPVIKYDRKNSPITPGSVWTRRTLVNQETDSQSNIVLFLASRSPESFSKLQAKLDNRYPNTKKGGIPFHAEPMNISSMRDYIISQFPGVEVFIYRSVKGSSPCL